MISIRDIRSIATNLPGAFEKPSYGGRPSWRTTSKMFAWVRENPEALVVWVDSVEEKLALIESEPRKFFTTDHYNGSPIVLVSLEQVGSAEATELITDSWCLRAPKRLVAEWEQQRSSGDA